MPALTLTCVHCSREFKDSVHVFGETPLVTFQRLWPDLEEHVRKVHPELAQQNAVMAGAFGGLLVASSFETKDLEANRHRLKSAAIVHQASKRVLLDADIRKIFEGRARGGRLNLQTAIELGIQLRDYMDYADVLAEVPGFPGLEANAGEAGSMEANG
jgi:hypothetical protein